MSRLTFGTVLMALAASACGSNTPTTPTAPTPRPPIVDTYQGTLGRNDAERFSFVTAVSGRMAAQIIQLDPSDLVIGFGLGTFNQTTGVCQVILSNDRAVLGTQIIGDSTAAGTLCVRVYDVGNIVDGVSYTIRVEHQ